MNTLAEAFESLKTRDDSIDPYEAMQHLCRANWLRGEKIDYFYHLKKKAKQVDGKLELICSILIGELPKQIQGKVKAFYVEKKDGNGTISELNARLLIMRAKHLLSERGITLDIECLNADELNNQQISDVSKVDKGKDDEIPAVGKTSSLSGRSQRKGKCFICQKPGHYANYCFSQFCQRCGGKGHNMKVCKNSPKFAKVTARSQLVPEESVIIEVSINNNKCVAMLDSGATMSVIEVQMLKRWNLHNVMKPDPGRLRVFDNRIVPSMGKVSLTVKVNDSLTEHQFVVVDINAGMSTVLGQNFLCKFGSTEFNWNTGEVRLGILLMRLKLWLRGGELSERIPVAEREDETALQFDINPQLPDDQRCCIQN